MQIHLTMHIGEKVKARSEELNIKASKLGDMIGYTKQNVYSIFERSSIDSELLKRLGKALDFNFFAWLANNEDLGTDTPQGDYGLSEKEISSMKEENERLRTQAQEAKERYELLKRVYKDDTGKNPPGTV